MAGLTAVICCLMDIIPVFVRHLVYRLSNSAQRIVRLANGLAITMWTFLKEVVRAVLSNGLAAVFSVCGGVLGMLIPIPVVNLIVSGLLSTIGFLLGRYVAGLPANIYRYYKYWKKKRSSRHSVRNSQ